MTDQDRGADRLALADRIRAHIGTIAPKCSLPVGEWNDIAEDFYEAADQLLAHPAASQGAREEIASIHSPAGTKLRYLGKNGHDYQLKRANEHLDISAIYTLAKAEIHDWHTDFYLVEVPDIPFNSVHFATSSSPAPSRAAAQPGVREALEALRHADIDLSMILPEVANEDMRRSIRKTLDMIDSARAALAPASANEVKP